MTKQDIDTAIETGRKVEAGVGQDHDIGRVLEIVEDGADPTVIVGWQSGVSTPISASELSWH